MNKQQWAEEFWSQQSAQRAANRINKKTGNRTQVEYTLFADGHSGWLVRVFAA